MTELQSAYIIGNGGDPPPALEQLLEFLTLEQMRQLNNAIREIVKRSGYGKVTLIVENYHPRFVGHEVMNELMKPVQNE